MKTDNMALKILFYFKYTLLCALLTFNGPLHGQELNAILISDNISYNKLSRYLIATGNVKVIYGKTSLYASEIRYDENFNKILVIGKFTIQEGENIITSSNDALIDVELKNGLIKGARGIINNKLQFSAQKFKKVNENISIFNTVVASTCKICPKNPIAFWQIRANKIIHNKKKQKIYFQNAKLDLLGLPILYLPVLSIPEPGISRASGVLVPKFSTSDKIAFSTKLPYYIALGQHKDVTITPYVMSKNNFIIETEYRQHLKNGYFELNNAFSPRDSLNQKKLNGFIKGKGSFYLKNNYISNYSLDLANTVNFNKDEKPFKNKYNYAKLGDDRLENKLDITKTTSNSFFMLGSSFTQSFRYKDFDGDGLKEEDPNVPIILPELYFKKNIKGNEIGENYSLSFQSVNLTQLSTGQYSRIGGKLEWKRNWITNNGLDIHALTLLNTNSYFIKNRFYKNAMPTGMFELHYPIKKTTKKASHLLEPITQLIFSPNKLIGYKNIDQNTSDSTTAEFEETNLFSTNRFPGFDDIESGIRANIGVKYLIYEPNGWEFTSTTGRVFRLQNLNQFDTSKSTGLNKLNSDYVSSFSIKSPQNFIFSTRVLIDDSLITSKNETQIQFHSKKYSSSIGYVWLDKHSILNIDNIQHEMKISADYIINNNWKFGANWRQNLETDSAKRGNFKFVYENDCAKVNISLGLKYNENDIVNRSFGMQVFFTGLGSNKNKKKFNNRCGI